MENHTRSSRKWHTPAISACLVILLLVAMSAQAFAAPAHKRNRGEPIEVIIDTDPGVDDAAAIVWLFSQKQYPVDVVGIAAVYGNTVDIPLPTGDVIPGVYFSTNNVLTLLDALGENYVPAAGEDHVQVVMGANEPLSDQPNSLGSSMLHGPDGLWGVSFEHPHDIEGLIGQGAIGFDAAQFYCDMAVEHPGATVLALGPLTNLALAAQTCAEDMQNFGQIVVMGGSQLANAPQSGNNYNLWQDAVAADVVLSAGLPVTLVTGEACSELTLEERHLQVLANTGNAATQLILEPMQMYMEMEAGFGGAAEVAYYDVPAAIYAASADGKRPLATAQSALVKVVTTAGLTEGQTVMGFGFADKIMMLVSTQELNQMIMEYGTDPETLMFMLAQLVQENPDNAQVVLDVRERLMRIVFLRGMR